MIGFKRFLLPLRPSPGQFAPVRRGGFVRRLVHRLRIAPRIALFVVFTGALLVIGLPALDLVALRQWIDDSRALFLVVRVCVYVAVVWYGPVWRGATGGERDRARIALAGFAVVLELFGTLRLIL